MTASSSATAVASAADCSPGTSFYGDIVEFLHHEAELLDAYRFDEWLALLVDDIHYVMPVRTTQFRAAGEGFHEVAFFDENLVSLRTRVQRLQTEFAWAETPPSRTRHFVTNVLVEAGEAANEFAVRSNFMITRTRADHGHQMFIGRREDVLRRDEANGLKLARRRILVDETVITGTNLSILF
jgi:3-phenylpropionate/cinnamic acid dioxygenase small subunit